MVNNVRPCKFCQRPIRLFRNSRTDRWLPVDAEPIYFGNSHEPRVFVDGNYVVISTIGRPDDVVYRPHWLNPECPNAQIPTTPNYREHD
jgi:hypothetical protein